jgi:hypothetical protein
MPAVVLGLLVVVWMASTFGGDLGYSSSSYVVGTSSGGLVVLYDGTGPFEPGFSWERLQKSEQRFFGYFYFFYEDRSEFRLPPRMWSFVPTASILTLLMPLAIGPFIRFRFRLWHYLAYTALVAVELAYYLRWQE